MKIENRILLLLLCGLFCGCETTNPARRESSSPDFVHEFSKFSFPESVGAFHRVNIRKYDQQGRDVGVGYNSQLPIASTVYVYPGPKDFALTPSPKLADVSEALLEQHLQSCKHDIVRNHPDAKLLTEGPFKITQGSNQFTGKQASFSINYRFGIQAQEAVTELYVFLLEPSTKFFVTDRQFVKYRITYPIARKTEAAAEVKAFMTNLTWPTK